MIPEKKVNTFCSSPRKPNGPKAPRAAALPLDGLPPHSKLKARSRRVQRLGVTHWKILLFLRIHWNEFVTSMTQAISALNSSPRPRAGDKQDLWYNHLRRALSLPTVLGSPTSHCLLFCNADNGSDTILEVPRAYCFYLLCSPWVFCV